jgi:hypothetical protein
MPSVGFEPVILATKRSKTCALDRAATWIYNEHTYKLYFNDYIV